MPKRNYSNIHTNVVSGRIRACVKNKNKGKRNASTGSGRTYYKHNVFLHRHSVILTPLERVNREWRSVHIFVTEDKGWQLTLQKSACHCSGRGRKCADPPARMNNHELRDSGSRSLPAAVSGSSSPPAALPALAELGQQSTLLPTQCFCQSLWLLLLTLLGGEGPAIALEGPSLPL